MSYPVLEKLIARQIHHWNNLRKYLEEPEGRPVLCPSPVLTVSRQAGSGGRKLATELAVLKSMFESRSEEQVR